MGALLSNLPSRDNKRGPLTPLQGPWPKIKNALAVHYRGILGCFFPLILLPWQPSKGKNDITVRCMWIWMAFFYLFKPVSIATTSMIPIFLLPMTGVMSSLETCGCFFDDNITLFLLGSMMLLLINSCGIDRHIILSLLCSGDNCQFSGKRIIFKATTAAFFLSMISNRLIVSSTIIQYLTSAYMNLQSKYKGSESNFDEMRYIVNNAVQVASTLGSSAMIHAGYTPIIMRAIWAKHPGPTSAYPDIFNFLQYTCFAFPVMFVMFILTFVYHMLMINWVLVNPMSGTTMTEMKNELTKQKNALPKYVTGYQMMCFFYYILYFLLSCFRWSSWLNMGWSSFYTRAENVPGVQDATVAAIFVVLLHIFPRTCNTLKFFIADTRKEIGVIKPESSVMWWRFTDKNMNYFYIFVIGSGIAINAAIRVSGLHETIANSYAKFLTNPSWNFSIFLICLFAVALGNIMNGAPACVIFLPLVLNMITNPASGRSSTEEWVKKLYLGALAVGIGTSFSFMCPFLYTPGYFCNRAGKVPLKKMIKYSIFPAILCMVILWVSLISYAPIIFDSSGNGIAPIAVGSAPAGGAPAGGAPDGGAPADGVPADGAPADGAPADGAPADGAPADGAPADGAPSDGTPADGAPADGSPAPAPEGSDTSGGESRRESSRNFTYDNQF